MHLNIPYLQAYVRNGYVLPSLAVESLEVQPCWIFGVNNIINRPLLFHCQLESGAVYSNLPLSAFTHSREWTKLGTSEQEHLSNLQYWDAQTIHMSAITFSFLQHKEVDVRTRTSGTQKGQYLFTLAPEHLDHNFLNVGYGEYPDAKLYHIIKLQCGCFGGYPNNFLRFYNADFVERDNTPIRLKRNQIEMFSEWAQ